MKRINYESDFVLRINFGDYDGDFKVLISTDGAKVIEATRVAGVLAGCAEVDGVLGVVLKDHGLAPGRVRVKTYVWHDNDWSENLQLVTPTVEDIVLTVGAGDEPSDAEVRAIAPYIKGEKGDKGDQGERGEKGDKGGVDILDEALITDVDGGKGVYPLIFTEIGGTENLYRAEDGTVYAGYEYNSSTLVAENFRSLDGREVAYKDEVNGMPHLYCEARNGVLYLRNHEKYLEMGLTPFIFRKISKRRRLKFDWLGDKNRYCSRRDYVGRNLDYLAVLDDGEVEFDVLVARREYGCRPLITIKLDRKNKESDKYNAIVSWGRHGVYITKYYPLDADGSTKTTDVQYNQRDIRSVSFEFFIGFVKDFEPVNGQKEVPCVEDVVGNLASFRVFNKPSTGNVFEWGLGI